MGSFANTAEMIMLLQAGAPVAAPNELIYVWTESTLAGKSIIVFLGVLSMFVWSVMLQKVLQTLSLIHI